MLLRTLLNLLYLGFCLFKLLAIFYSLALILILSPILFTLSSCSLFKKNEHRIRDDFDFSKKRDYVKSDYVDHLKSQKNSYLNSNKVNVIGLRKSSKSYLEKVALEIQIQNELFFDQDEKVNFSIIKNEIPFHFSLPGKNIFISSGLINKYIKSEKLLYCLITYELIRSEKNIYKKQTVVPTGFITTEKMLSMMRIKIEDKVEIHKWAFYLLKRIGIDTNNYLSWLQIQNRNSVDFSMQLGDISIISREEALFKAFIVKNTSSKSKRFHAGSSRSFYKFINNIKR